MIARHAGGELRLTDIIHHHRADNAGGRPSGQQAAVNGADELGTEHVGKIGWHGGEAAAIHRQDDAEGEHEQRLVADLGEERRRRIERDAKNEERVIGVLPPDIVG